MKTKFALPIEIIRTDRKKTVSIEINDTQIKIIVPKKLSELAVEKLIAEKTVWIKKKVEIQLERTPQKPKEYVNGESFSYLGRNYRLKIVKTNTNETKLKNGYLCVPVAKNLKPEEQKSLIRSNLSKWYETHALKSLQDKTRRYASLMSVTPHSVRVKDYKSRWGSCSVSGEISYNWKIVMAPHHIVDYVVVHELAHLLEHNHSAKYWKYVENVFDDYIDRRSWLKANGHKLIV